MRNRISPHLEQNMIKFQTGGMKRKEVVDNLIVLRAKIDHGKYLRQELFSTFYDTEKCFDSSWLWKNGTVNPIAYGILDFSQLSGGGGGGFLVHILENTVRII